MLMPSGCRMGICYGCVLPLREGAVRDLRNGEITTAGARRRRPDPDLRQRRRRRLRHRPLTYPSEKEPAMTVLQKKPENPIAHLTAEDIELSARSSTRSARRSATACGEDDAAYIRKVIDVQRKLELGSRAVLLVVDVPAGLGRRDGRPLGRQDPREHGDRAQHPARPVGLDARPEDPLHDVGVGHGQPGRAVEALAQRAAPHVHERDRQGQRPRLRHHARRRGPAWHPLYLAQPLWNFINACFFEYGIAAYDLELGKNLATQEASAEPGVPGRAPGRCSKKIRNQATKDYVVHPLLSGPVVPADPGRQLHRQRGAQPVDRTR